MRHRTLFTGLLAGGLSIAAAGPASAGKLAAECVPGSPATVAIRVVDLQGSSRSEGPTVVTAPGVYSVTFYGPATNGDGTLDTSREVVWGTADITVTADMFDCSQAEPTTTVATTTTVEATTSTAPTISSGPTTTRDDSSVSVGAVTTRPGDVPTEELPATGDDPTAAIIGALAGAAGGALLLVRRRPA